MNKLRNWKRQGDGTYLAHDHYWTYEVGRQDPTDRDTDWYLKGYPSGNPKAAQVKRNFTRMRLAQMAVDSTICSRCMQHFPFREMEQVRARSIVFTCRDKEACEQRVAEREAETRAMLAHRDHDEIKVRDGRHGPELVFDNGTHGIVINVTENDLDYLQGMLARRSITRLATAAGRCPECYAPKGTHHKLDCSQRGGGEIYGADPVPAEDGGPEGSLAS